MGWTTGRVAFKPREGLLPGAILDLNPNGYWKLNEGAGSVAFDSSGLGRHGTYNGSTVLFDQPGPYDSYPDFAQSGAGVTIPDEADWSPSPGGLTVVGLLQHGDSGGPAITPLRMITKATEWSVAFTGVSSAVAATFNTTGIIPHRLREETTVTQQVWTLFIATIPIAAFPNIWLDNVLSAGGTVGPTGTQQGNTGTSLLLGDTTGTDSVPRSLAHVALYKKILTTLERDSIADAAVADGWY